MQLSWKLERGTLLPGKQLTLAPHGCTLLLLQKNILGLVQGPPCRIDVDFKDEKGRRYQKTAVVKGKNGETEELPLYTNHDNIFGEVCMAGTPLSCTTPTAATPAQGGAAI